MRKIIILCLCIAFWPAASQAATAFDDSAAFTVAAAKKLTAGDNIYGVTGKELNTNPSTPSNPKETYECTRDGNCASTQKCNTATNKCVPTCDLVTCANNKFCVAGTSHSYSCKDCLTDTNCTAGKKCSSNSCVSCSEGDENCRCPSGEVADGKGGCKVATPTGTCNVWDDTDPTSLYWNANGSKTIGSNIRCWNGYGANATITVPNGAFYDNVRIRFWQGATINGSFSTNQLGMLENTSNNPHTVTFNGHVTVNGRIILQTSVTPVFKGGISGNYTCESIECPGSWGSCKYDQMKVIKCPWQ